jgi:VanZ family protein
MVPLRHPRLWLAMSVALVAAIVYSSLAPDFELPVPTPDGFDKVEHFTAYCGLALWFTGLYPRARYWQVVTGLLALGLAVEIAQGTMQLGRSADVLDMLANAVGVLVGLLLALSLTGGWAQRVESWLVRR